MDENTIQENRTEDKLPLQAMIIAALVATVGFLFWQVQALKEQALKQPEHVVFFVDEKKMNDPNYVASAKAKIQEFQEAGYIVHKDISVLTAPKSHQYVHQGD